MKSLQLLLLIIFFAFCINTSAQRTEANEISPRLANAPSGSAGGDLSGSYPNPSVIGLQARPISANAPKTGDVLKWNGTEWIPENIANNSASAEPLKFAPSLGKKIILYPGASGDVGLSVQGNLLQIHSDHSNADVAIGYDASGAFQEKLRVKANGALALSGNAGQPGQVLTSNGNGSAPVWKQVGGTTVTQYKNYETAVNTLFTGNQAMAIDLLSQSFVLDRPARIVINAKLRVSKSCSSCSEVTGDFYFSVDGNAPSETAHNYFKADLLSDAVISSHMIDLPAGSHVLQFWVNRFTASTGLNSGNSINFRPLQSSVMIIPFQ